MSTRLQTQIKMLAKPYFTPVQAGLLQRKCACGNHTVAGGECAECKDKKGMFQRRPANESSAGEVPPIVHEVLRSPGQPLDPATRAFMEPRFGYDFSQVRVHTDAKAAESAQAVNAVAYAVGRDVVFGAGQPALGSFAGKGLLAHELTHVVQQQRAASAAGQPLRMDPGNGIAEREAEAQSRLVAEGPSPPRPALSVRTHGVSLQRQSIGGGPGNMDDEGTLLRESLRQSTTLDNFDLDQATLKPQHLAKLKEFKERFQVLLGRHPDSFISVIGHTDATGTEQHNETLGQDRADAVKNELTSGDNALPAEIIHAGSLGESLLTVETKGREAKNRRVEIIPTLRQFFKLPLPTPPQPLPSLPGEAPKIEFDYCKRNPDLCIKPKPEPPGKPKVPPDIFKPLPPAPPKGTQKSVLDVLNEKIVDPIVNGVTRGLGLPKDIQKKVLELAHDGVEKGITEGLKSELGRAGVDSKGIELIEKAVELAIKEKGQGFDRKSETEGSPFHREPEPPKKREEP